MVDGLTVGWLVLTPFESVSSGAEKRFADAQARTGWVVGGAAVLLAAAVAFWASRRLLRPVRQVAEATHRLAAGHYDTRVPERADDDEIGRLAHDFNQLALTLQRNEAMRREFMADVSHELRTPLGVLHGELEALEDGVRPLDAAGAALAARPRSRRCTSWSTTCTSCRWPTSARCRTARPRWTCARSSTTPPAPSASGCAAAAWRCELDLPPSRCRPSATRGGCASCSPTCSRTAAATPTPAARCACRRGAKAGRC